jgi:hypothetical protein
MRNDMQKRYLNLMHNEDGFVLGGAILISAILILAGVLALWTSTTEVQVVRNEGLMVREFYDAEGGVIDALANYNAGTTDWLTNTFLSMSQSDASSVVVSEDPLGNPVATIEARCITDTAYDTGLSDEADRLPLQNHIAPPPTGSGYSLRYFEVRRYGITGKSTDGNTTIQVGAWKVFNKY